jgi:hypothetical protein
MKKKKKKKKKKTYIKKKKKKKKKKHLYIEMVTINLAFDLLKILNQILIG